VSHAVECIPVYALRGNPLPEIESTSSPFQSLPFSPTHPLSISALLLPLLGHVGLHEHQLLCRFDAEARPCLVVDAAPRLPVALSCSGGDVRSKQLLGCNADAGELLLPGALAGAALILHARGLPPI